MQRLRWVERLDTLIWTIDTRGAYPAPVLCEQTAAIEDYFTFRPQRRETIADLIRREQLQVGPWYVQPLEPLVNPEALVRNLLLGRAASITWGDALNVASLAAVSSHIGQMPQILLGFGINTAVVQNALPDPGSEFWWQGPDGSRVLLLRTQVKEESPASLHAFESVVSTASKQLADSTSGESVLLMTDFPGTAPPVAEMIALLQPTPRSPNVVQSGIASYASRAWKHDFAPAIVQGELDSPKYAPLSPGVFSTRMWLKQNNAAVETLLVRWAEPAAAWTQAIDGPDMFSADGSRYGGLLEEPAQLIDHAWSVLLRNHAPAALSGASVDAAQQETELLFNHAREIGELVTERCLSRLAEAIDTSSAPFENALTPVVVFNPANDTRTDIVSCEVAMTENDAGLEVVDRDGTLMLVEAGDQPGAPVSAEAAWKKSVRFLARNLPGLGYATFGIRVAGDPMSEPVVDDALEISNEYFNVALDPSDGTLSLFDKQTGRSFAGLNRYVDRGERGDAFLSAPPLRDTEISIATNTPLRPQRFISPLEQSLHLFQILRLPQGLTANRDARLPLAAQFVPISIWTTIRVVPGIPRVDVEVTVANAAADHRLSAHFPTGIMTDEVLLDSHFGVVRRSIRLPRPEETADWEEQPSADHAHQGFVTVLGTDSGLTVATRGLPHAAIVPNALGCEIMITLLRCVGWLNRSDLPNRQSGKGPELEIPGAQGAGEFHFDYSIIAHSADPRPAWREAWAFRTPPRAVVTDTHNGPLPVAASLLQCNNPDFILTSIKPAQDRGSIIVRGYNVSDQPQTIVLTLGIPARFAHPVRLDETPAGAKIKVNRRRQVTVEARPAEIVTLKLIS